MPKRTKEIRTAGIQLSKANSISLHQQLYDQLRNMILRRQLRSGERITSGRELAKELSISRIVVTSAYEQLIIEGYLTGKPGSGTFVADIIPDELLNIKPTDCLADNKKTEKITSPDNKLTIIAGGRIESKAFQIGLPSLDSFPYKTWNQCANLIFKNLKSLHLGYEDTLGYWPLRKAVAAYLRISRGVKCEAEQVIIVTGSQQGLNLITKVLLKKNECVWVEDPGYPGIKAAIENLGILACPVPVSKSGIEINVAQKKYDIAKLVYVTPSYQFPLGYTLSYQRRKQLIKYAAAHSMWILEDDYDSEFRYQGNPLSSLQGLDDHDRVIYSGTFSKVIFPGLRLAYVVVPKLDMVAVFGKAKETIDRQSPILEQAILAKFMEEGHFLRHIRKMRLLYAERQEYLINCLEKNCKYFISYYIPPAGMHLRCKLAGKINIEKFKANIYNSGLRVSFVNDFAITYLYPREFLLGYTAFTKYQLRMAVEKLAVCLQNSL